MNLGGQLYKLQQVDMELQRKRQVLSEVEASLRDDAALVAARDDLPAKEQTLAAAMKKQKDMEWEVADLEEKKKQVNYKLYSGVIRNPKELSNLGSELASLKNRMGDREDELLELMARVEELQAEVKDGSKKLQDLQGEWQEKQAALSRSKTEVEAEIDELEEAHGAVEESIDAENLRLYDQLKLRCGQAVARVEKGRCQGCHIALPTSQWQRARSGDLVHCNNCGRILYVE